jgi:hypothetical protein
MTKSLFAFKNNGEIYVSKSSSFELLVGYKIQNAFGSRHDMENEETKAPVRKTPKVRSSVASEAGTTAAPKRSRKKIEEPIVAVQKQQLKHSTKTAYLWLLRF